MKTIAKVLIPNKSWLLEDHGTKLGTLNKDKKGFSLLRQGKKYNVGTIKDVEEQFGVTFSDTPGPTKVSKKDEYSVYDFPCSSKPFNPLYNVRQRLPIYAKSTKSKSQYCAGYYVIQFRKGWVKSFCPKLITLERYPFQGPFKTELEMRSVLNSVSKQ
jgi:hypothetical protein